MLIGVYSRNFIYFCTVLLINLDKQFYMQPLSTELILIRVINCIRYRNFS
mgnify:CR=1 FL=1